MSQENVEIVRRCYELWDSRQWSAIPELFDPDASRSTCLATQLCASFNGVWDNDPR
jgi:hypothetical protein